jgi:U3 small nucleolar RNA-associated protein 19
MPLLTRPILLADFLTHCYDSGSGPIAVLALQSLFTLIAQHNLDYPHFFLSLYNLCRVDIFSAKYRTTFFSLLSRSLQSTNLPAYVVAAFIKRLAYLALHSPSCNSRFCVAQVTWLLRKHPQCLCLLHSNDHRGDSLSLSFDNFESVDLEAAGALQSSLWELLLLERHFLVAAADLARTVRDPRSTDNGRNGLHTRVEEHLTTMTYAELLTEQLSQVASKAKKQKPHQDGDDGSLSISRTALSHRVPHHLLPPTSLVACCFGLP